MQKFRKNIHSTLGLLVSAGYPYRNIFTDELVGTYSSADLLPALNDTHTASIAWALVLRAPHKHLVNILEAGAIPSAADLPKVVDALKRMRGKRARRALATGFPDWENRVWNVILKDYSGANKDWVTRLLYFAIPGINVILFDPLLPSCKKGSTSDAASYGGSRSRGDSPRGHLSGSL